MFKSSNWYKASKVFSICLLINLILFAVFFSVFKGRNWTIYTDSQRYVLIAQNLVEHAVFSKDANTITNDTNVLHQPDGRYPPLYPFFIALFKILGLGTAFIILANYIMASFIGVLIFRLGKTIFSPKTGFWAAVFFSVEPTVSFWTGQATTEVIFTLLLLSILFIVIEKILASEKTRYGIFALTGFLIGLGALTRHILTYFVFFIAAFLIFWQYIQKKKMDKKYLSAVILLFIIFAATIFPWYLRNRLTFGVWSFGALQADVLGLEADRTLQREIAAGNKKAEAILEKQKKDLEEMQANGLPDNYIHNPAYLPYIDGRIMEIIKTFPLTFLKHHFSGIKDFFLVNNYGYFFDMFANKFPAFKPYHKLASFFGYAVWIAISFFALIGLLAFYKETKKTKNLRRLCAGLLLFIGILYFVLTTGQVFVERLRYPVAPLFFLFAVYGFIYFTQVVKLRSHPYLGTGSPVKNI